MTFTVNPVDLRFIEQLQRATRGARTLLCTLARRGKALEHDQPERAAFVLTALRPHPLYKGGRLAFDMLEIEDLMLDAAPLDPLSDLQLTQLLSAVAIGGNNLADVLRRFGSDGRDGAPGPAVPGGETSLPSLTAPGGEPAGPTALLPRVRLGPETAGPSGEGSGRDAGLAAGPELLSSDYLYDYVVLGCVEVLSRTMAQ